MTDPIDQIFNGEPDGIDEDEMKVIQASQEQRINDLADMSAEEEQPQSSPSPQSPQQETATAVNPKEEEKVEEDDTFDMDDVGELASAIPLGVADFAVDTVNLIPGVDVQKVGKHDNNVAQAVRDISGLVVPTIALSLTGIGVLGAASKASKIKLLADPFVKWLGTTAFSAGAGATVDSISELSEDHNAAGSLKKSFPKTFAWIPDDIATLDSDSPDVKRIKNVTEGTGLGIFGNIVESFATILRGSNRVRNATQWIPESEKAKNWLAKNAEEVADNAEDVVANSAAKRSDDLDSLGSYNFSKSQNLDEPVFGLHDMYGYEESGIRSADNLGIVGASVDLVRINNNLDTVYGRLGSVMTEPALKFALEGVEEYDSVMRGLRDSLSEADQYGYKLSDGKVINSKTIKDAGEQLAKDMGYMTNSELDTLLKRYQTGINPDTGAPMLSSKAAQAVKASLKEAMRQFGGESDALVRTSIAGQVSDLAQASRYAEGTAAVPRTQEQLLDRIELLMVANGEAGKQRGFLLKMLDVVRRGGKELSPKELRKKGADITAQLQAEAKQTVDVLREIKETRPNMLGPLLLAYENTDGSVKTMDALNNYMRQSTGVLRKAFIDRQPEIPSVVMQGFWANVYNSTLSALATPIKAGLANAVVLVEKPVTLMAGALIKGDGYTMRRGMYQYMAMTDTLGKGMKYFGETLRRSGIDPNYSGVAGRESLIKQNDKQLEIMNAFADAKALEGDYGPQAMMAQIEAIDDLAKHPWLRMGTRLMQAADGFTQAVIGNIEARGKAFDLVAKGKIDADAMDTVAQSAYKEIWKLDEQGRAIISDEAVKKASGEIAMNLDNAANDALSSVIRSVPALKPFLLFTKTPINMMGFAASHSPMALFIDNFAQFGKNFDQLPAGKVEQLLKSKGIEFNPETAEIAYNSIRAEMKGRKALGTLAVMGAGGLFLSGNITGNGIYDRQKQQLRRAAGQQPRSIKLPNGQQVSYDNLGAITDWIALTVDIMDNFDVLAAGDLEQLMSGMGFVISASFTDKSMLAGIEPLYDILSGNPAAINRWAASFLPAATMPGASQMAELTRLMSPNLRVVEERLDAMLANRTPLKATLPDQYDWIDGDKIVDYAPEEILTRLWNTYSPWKVNGKISDVKQFLIDIEYDHRPNLKTDGRGTDLSIKEQAEVYRIMGRDKIFKSAVERIMKSQTGKQFREAFRIAQQEGMEPQLNKFTSIHTELTKALNLAKELAIAEIDANSNYAILNRKYEDKTQEQSNLLSTVQNILKVQ